MISQFFSESHGPEINEEIGRFVSRHIWGVTDGFERFCSLGVFDHNGLVSGVVYHNYQPSTGVIEVSAASDSRKWLSAGVLQKFISMPFDKLSCQAIIARHSAEAKHLRRMWTRVGGIEYVIPRLRGKDAPDEVLSVLTDDAWNACSFSGQIR